MADKYWTGASSGAFGTPDNWSPSGVPTNGDVLFFTDTPTNAIVGSDQSSIALAGVHVGPGYDNTIGSSGSFLILDTPYLRYAGSGTSAFISLQDSSGSTVTVYVTGTPSTTSPTTAGLHLDTNSTQDLDLRVHAGVVTVENSARVSECTVTQIPSNAASVVPAEVYLGTSLVTTTTLNITGGTCYASTGFTTVNVTGDGTLYCEADDWTTINVFGGNVNWRNSGAGQTLTTLNVYRGTFNGKNAKANDTITNTTIWDGNVYVVSGFGVPTFTNAATMKGSGSFIGDSGLTQTIGSEV